MIVRDSVNYVMKYSVSDTESLRKVHLFVWAEPFDGAAEARSDSFSVQDLPPAEARNLIGAFLAAARAQSSSPNPVAAAAASDAAARLQHFLELAERTASSSASALPPETNR
ncbi:MAG: hypothetical protein AAB074_04875 [Planctomycetota bacterium]